MVDFEGSKRGGFERDNGAEESLGIGSSNYQDAPANASAGTRIVAPDANGAVNLPAGTSLEDITVEGRDLVINLADGSRIIIPDGAIIVPQLVIDGVAVPPLNVSALLNDALTPEAQPGQLPSSGGEFDDGEAFLQDAFDLGDLLPYTELPLIVEEEEEVIPFDNNEPDVVIETPDNPVGVENAIATVAERGLPERGEPAEPEGTADETDAEFTTGTIIFNSPDGLSAIILNGDEITSIGQEFVTPFGTLTITSINLEAGEIGFSYRLADNLLGETEDGNFFVTVIDVDGDTASASLKILVEDDSPIAAEDIGIVPAGSHAPIMGNVLVNDESGADDYPEGEEGPDAVTVFSSVSTGGSADAGGSVQGEYGELILNADGSYTYVRDFNTPGGVSEVFNYTIIDQDGSTSSTTLTINIEDALDSVNLPEIGEGTVVEEGGLPPRDGEPVGTGEGADADPDNNSDPSETTGSTITFNSPDGIESITVNGVAIDPTGLPQTISDDATGTLVITGYTYDPETGDGSIDYEYTLGDNTSGDDTSVSFDIVVTDLDGDIAEDTLVITIVDDQPTAIDDIADQASENAPVTVDVFANDVPGADDVALDTIALVEGTLTGAGTLVNNGDGTFTYTPAPGEEGQVFFRYSIEDGDGDPSDALVTINLLPDSTPEIRAQGEDSVNEAGLAARDGEPEGSDEPSNSEFTQGGIFIDTGNDTIASLVVNGVNVTSGGTVTTSKGVLTITEDSGTYTYTYELTDNTLSDPDSDTFTLVVTDSDGDTANTSIVIAIIDDMPTAADDANSIASGEYGPIGGNVLANDTEGADGAVVTTYSGAGGSGSAGDEIQGEWGKLTIEADGTYTYTRDPGTPGGQIDTFDYTIVDGDSDPSSAKLIITIGDSTTTLDLPVAGEAGTLVDEAGLDGPPNGADVGTDAASNSETTVGTFTYTAPDGPATVFIDGVEITSEGQTFLGAHGTLTVTAISAGSITYSYELTENTSGDTTFDDFVVRVEDQDDDFSQDTLRIDIVDDEPLTSANDPVALDDDALSGNPGGDGDANPDSANTTGTLAHQFGADGAGSITFASMNGQSVDINGVTVTYTWAGDTLTANDGSNDVFSVQVDPATGDYVVTQLAPLDHHLSGDDVETDASFVLTYTVTDGDTDFATGTLTVNVDDDTPEFGEADGSAPTLVTDDTDTEGGSDTDSASFADAFAPLFGADGQAASDALVYSLSINGGDATPSGLTDAVTDEAILLRISAGDPNVIEGYLETSGDVAFTLTLNPVSGSIEQEQFRAIEHDNDADPAETTVSGESESMAADLIKLTATITDGDGDEAAQTIDIGDSFTFEDDGPAATDNANSLGEGEDVSGNVVTDDDTFGTDSSGADGYAADGPVVDADFVSANQGVTFTSKSVDPNTGVITIVTSAGTLTIEPDGSYTFDSPANTINGDTEIVFTYTIEDGDGDPASADLTIDITNVAGAATAPDLMVDEKGLPDGTGELSDYDYILDLDPNPISDQSEIDSDKIIVNGVPDTTVLRFELIGGSYDAVSNTWTATGSNGTLVLDAETGDYTYTLTSSFGHDPDAPGADRNDEIDVESFDYQVYDSLNNLIVDSSLPGGDPIEVDIRDDIPEVDINTTDENPENMLTFDEQTEGGTSVDTADFSGAFNVDSFLFGADGAGTLDTTYALVLNTQGAINPTTLTSDEAPVYLYQLADGTIIGSTSNTAPLGVDGSTVFTLEVGEDSGIVTLTQYAELDHSVSDTADYDDDTIPLPGGLVSLEATATIIDSDQDVVSDDASLDLGSYVNFADDGPNASISASGVSVTHDETPGLDGDADDTSDADIIALFAGVADVGVDPDMPAAYAVSDTGLSDTGSDYGADGAGTTVFSLDVASEGVDSGLNITGGGDILLYTEGDLIVGRVGNAGGDAAFAIAIDPDSGVISVVQYLSIDHPTGGASHDEAVSIDTAALLGVVTVTDEEGDSDTADIEIGNLVSFEDDGPAVAIELDADADVVLDESGLGAAAATLTVGSSYAAGDDPDVDGTNALSIATSGTAIVTFATDNPDYGADGQGAAPVYALQLDAVGPLTNLTLTDGSTITLVQENGTIFGVVDNGPLAGDAAFAIAIDSGTGVVTVEQYLSLEHPDSPDNYDETVTLDTGAISVVVTVEDGDDDTADSNAIDISGNITFHDDGLSIQQNGDPLDELVLDESPVGEDEGGDNDPAGRASITADFSDNFDATFGADGAAVPTSISYALLLDGAIDGGPIGSGLYALDPSDVLDVADDGDGIGQGGEIMLGFDGTDIVGMAGGTEYFRISVDGNGVVTFSQTNNVWHADTGDFDDTAALMTATADLIQLEATAEDGDGDTASATIDLGGGIFQIEDDGPSEITPAAITNTLFNKIGGTATASLDTMDGLVGDNFGTDGAGSITFANIVNGVTDSGLTHDGQAILLYVEAGGTMLVGRATVDGQVQDVFEIELDAAGNDYTVTMIRTIDDGSGAFFDDLSGGVAGNPPFKLVDSADTGAQIELLFTPRTGGDGDPDGSINSDTDDLGANSQFIALGDGVSIDFGDFTYVANAGGTSDDEYFHVDDGDVNGFRFTIDQISNGTTVDALIRTFDYTGDTGSVATPSFPSGEQQLPVDDDYVQDFITKVDIYDAAGNFLFSANFTYSPGVVDIDIRDSDGVILDSATNTISYGGLTFFPSNTGSLLIQNLLSDWKVETYTDDGYDRLTIDNQGIPATTDGKFSISELQIAQTNDGAPQNLVLDLQITDADGDTLLLTDALDITFQPAALEGTFAPVVLDLDGGGNAFSSLDAGLAYDYNGDGVKTQTAWVAAGSAILAFDMNGDGIVTDASEFVFGGNGVTDLEAIAAKYDENGDNVLDANDAAYGKFGVWIDADLDAVADAGEFVSLADAGIESINLVSDGIQTAEADGDVTVFGTSSFTWNDGSTGEVSDAGFSTGSDVDPAMMEALLALQDSDGSTGDNLADASGLDTTGDAPKLAQIVDDVMAESAIDLMIDSITGGDSDIVGISHESGYLGDGALAQMIDTGAFAYDGTAITDMHEDAAALAAMNA